MPVPLRGGKTMGPRQIHAVARLRHCSPAPPWMVLSRHGTADRNGMPSEETFRGPMDMEGCRYDLERLYGRGVAREEMSHYKPAAGPHPEPGSGSAGRGLPPSRGAENESSLGTMEQFVRRMRSAGPTCSPSRRARGWPRRTRRLQTPEPRRSWALHHPEPGSGPLWAARPCWPCAAASRPASSSLPGLSDAFRAGSWAWPLSILLQSLTLRTLIPLGAPRRPQGGPVPAPDVGAPKRRAGEARCLIVAHLPKLRSWQGRPASWELGLATLPGDG